MDGKAGYHSSWVGSDRYPVRVFSAVTGTRAATSGRGERLRPPIVRVGRLRVGRAQWRSHRATGEAENGRSPLIKRPTPPSRPVLLIGAAPPTGPPTPGTARRPLVVRALLVQFWARLLSGALAGAGGPDISRKRRPQNRDRECFYGPDTPDDGTRIFFFNKISYVSHTRSRSPPATCPIFFVGSPRNLVKFQHGRKSTEHRQRMLYGPGRKYGLRELPEESQKPERDVLMPGMPQLGETDQSRTRRDSKSSRDSLLAT